jgi:hypothetical protein
MVRSVLRAGRMRRLGYAISLIAIAVAGLTPPALAVENSPQFKPYWVQNHTATDLWSAPDGRAVSFERVAPFSYFHVLQPQVGARLNVLNPLTMGTAWIDAVAVGPSGEPPVGYGQKPPETAAKPSLPSRIVGGANVRSRPEVAPDNLVGRLAHNAGVAVLEEVKGADGDAWYRIDAGQFVHSSLVRKPRPFPPHPGRLIEADLSEPVLVTAYEDGKPVYSALALKGTIGWGTPTGFFTIKRRVQNETMDSRTLGIPNNAPGGYLLKNVLYTQYFTDDGASIHYNYWSGNFGYSGSHGCLGMSLADSEFFWEWAGVGTPLIIRE